MAVESVTMADASARRAGPAIFVRARRVQARIRTASRPYVQDTERATVGLGVVSVTSCGLAINVRRITSVGKIAARTGNAIMASAFAMTAFTAMDVNLRIANMMSMEICVVGVANVHAMAASVNQVSLAQIVKVMRPSR